MTDELHIKINEKVWLEVDYKYTPACSSYDYNSPPDDEEFEICKVRLCNEKCEIDLTYMMDELQDLMSIDAMIEKVSNHIHN